MSWTVPSGDAADLPCGTVDPQPAQVQADTHSRLACCPAGTPPGGGLSGQPRLDCLMLQIADVLVGQSREGEVRHEARHDVSSLMDVDVSTMAQTSMEVND
jgi:hypothetical protein